MGFDCAATRTTRRTASVTTANSETKRSDFICLQCEQARETNYEPSLSLVTAQLDAQGEGERASDGGIMLLEEVDVNGGETYLRISLKAENQKLLLVQRAAAIGRRDVRFKKSGYALIGVNLVFYFGKAVAFVLVDFVFDNAAALLDCVHHLLRFGLGAARIVATG